MSSPAPTWPTRRWTCPFRASRRRCSTWPTTPPRRGRRCDLPGLAASFAAAVSDTLVPRTMEAARRTGYGKVAVAGGVAANSRIRADLERACRASGHRLYLPALSLCGDNGAMIGCQAYYEYQAGRRGDLALNAYATRSIEQG